MPRRRREHAPGALVHVISRFVNRAHRLDAPGAREQYLHRAGEAFARTDWTALAYGLMSSHSHWCALAGESSCESLFKPLHTGFAAWANRSDGALGPVFADRPTVVVVAPARAGRLIGYIHNNPVRAGLVSLASESGWTSHGTYAGLAPAPPWLDVRRGLALAGFESTAAGRRGFDAFVASLRAEPRDRALSDEDYGEQRRGLRLCAGAPVEPAVLRIGTVGTHDGARGVLGIPAMPIRPRWAGDLGAVLAVVCAQRGVPASLVRSRCRGREASMARRLFVTIAVDLLGRTVTESSALLGISVQAGSALLRGDPARREEIAGMALQIGAQFWGIDAASLPAGIECGRTELALSGPLEVAIG